MCQAFRRRDASQKRRRRRYAEAQHRQRPPVPGIIFDRERKGSLSLSLPPSLLNTAKSKTTRFIGDRGGRRRLRLRLRRGGGWHRRRFEEEAAAQVLDLFDCFRQSRLSLPLKASSMKDYSSAMDNFDRGRGQPRRPFFVAWRFCGMSILLRFVQLPSFSSFFLFFFLSFLLSPSYPLPAVLAWNDLRCLLFEIYIYIYVGFRVLVKRTIVHVGK